MGGMTMPFPAAGGAWWAPSAPLDDTARADDRRVADRRWDPLLVCVAAYILTAVGRIHQLFAPLELIHLAVIAGVLAIVLFVIDGNSLRRVKDVRGPTATLIAAFIFWMMVTVPTALVIGTSFDLVFNNFIKTAVMSLIIAASVRGVRDVERLAFVYLVAAVVYASVIVTRFDANAAGDGRLGHLYYYDANDFATFVVTAMPLAIHFLYSGESRRIRLFAAAGLVVLTFGFVWAGSRGGFIALVAVTAFVIFRFSAIPLRWRGWGTAMMAAVLLATASEQYWERMQTITSEQDYNHTSETGRLQIWGRGIDYMVGNPVLGVGAGNFPAAEGILSPLAERQQFGIGVRWNAPHNSYVQVGAELGVPGLALYIAVIVSAFFALRHGGRLTPPLAAALLGFVIGSVFLSLAYSEMLYTLIALAVGLRKVAGRAVEC